MGPTLNSLLFNPLSQGEKQCRKRDKKAKQRIIENFFKTVLKCFNFSFSHEQIISLNFVFNDFSLPMHILSEINSQVFTVVSYVYTGVRKPIPIISSKNLGPKVAAPFCPPPQKKK